MSDEERGRYATEIECRELIESLPNECCLRCRFFRIFEEATYDSGFREAMTEGFCRRYPPGYYPDDASGGTSFPLVSGTEWCGEFDAASEDRGMDYVYAAWAEKLRSSTTPTP